MNDYVKAGMFAFLGAVFAVITGFVAISAMNNFGVDSRALGRDNLRSVQFNAFVSEDEFSGVVVATEDLGDPQFDYSYPNSDRAYNVLIRSKDGTYCMVLNFHLGRHAKDDFADLRGKELRFPDALWPMRASAFID